MRRWNLNSEAKVVQKDTKWYSGCTHNSGHPHLVNGFLFTLRLIAGIFSSLWVDGLRLAIFPSPKLRFHLSNWNDDDGFVRASHLGSIADSDASCTHTHTSSLSTVVVVINWISSLRRGSLGFLRHDMIILPHINEKWKTSQRICPCHPEAEMDGRAALSHGCVSKDTWHIRSHCKRIVIKCTVNGNLKLDTFSPLMTMKQALMTSN